MRGRLKTKQENEALKSPSGALPWAPVLLTGYINMSSSHCFNVHAFGCNIQAAASCPEAYVILERYIFPTLPRSAGSIDKPDLILHITRVADRFQLSANNVIVASANRPISLVPEIIRVLDETVIQHLTTLHAVHAGVVLWGGRALLLPGVTHAGKSSLVAELLHRGATYFSDEYALIDSEGRVHPYPRPLLLRNGNPEQVPVLPEECHASIGNTAAPLACILSLEYKPESTWSVTAVSQSEGLLILLRNTPHVLAETPDMVASFLQAVKGAVCYVGYRPGAAETVDHILQILKAAPSNSGSPS
jgi:hypothetical protein